MNILNKIRRLSNKEFFVEHTDAKPMFLSGIIWGFVNGLKIKDHHFIQCFFKNGEIDWITLKQDQIFLFNKIIEIHLRNNNYWQSEIKKWLKKKKIIVDIFNELKEKKLKGVSDKELIVDLERIFNNQIKARKVSSLIDSFNLCAGERLIELLTKSLDENKLVDINKVFCILTAPEKESFLNEARNDLIKITGLIKKNKSLQNKIASGTNKRHDLPKRIEDLIKKHLDEFSWIKTISFSQGMGYGFNQVITEIRGLIKEKTRTNNRNRGIENNKKQRKMLIKKHRFNKEIRAISDLSVLFIYWQDLRKENTMRSTYLATRYLKELAKRRKIDFDTLTYLYFPELKLLMDNKIKLKEIKARKNGAYFIFYKDKFEVYSYKQVKDVLDKILMKDIKGVKKLQGMCASRGYAKGRVKVLMNIKEMKKVKKGNILVAPGTRPEVVPAMKRAAAVIIDDGGITSHAAIVSRELGLPCVIGTKVATKVLKDGDLVEVDADQGIIRIIKK